MPEHYWIAVIVFFTGWLICGYLAYGYEYAMRKQAMWDEKHCREMAIFAFWAGPFALLTQLIDGSTKYGRRYPWQDTLTSSRRRKSWSPRE